MSNGSATVSYKSLVYPSRPGRPTLLGAPGHLPLQHMNLYVDTGGPDISETARRKEKSRFWAATVCGISWFPFVKI